MNPSDLTNFTFSLTSKKCRRFITDKIHAGQGFFIIRIKVFEECHNLEIHLKFHEKYLKNSQKSIKTLYPENCDCKRDLKDVLRSLKCETKNAQIEEDLMKFNKINYTEIRNYVKKNYEKSRSASVCNYVIKNSKIYRKCYGEYVGFKMFIDHILNFLISKVNLKDFEFFINLGDWPLIKKSQNFIIPMISWCGSKDTLDIVIPTYDLTESSLNMMQRTVLDIFSVQNEKFKWNEKVEKAFFRGRDSRRERLELVTLSKIHPELFNCSITNFFFYNDEIDKFGPKVDQISFFEFFKFKFQINIDGTVAAYRFPYLLAGNSIVLKQDSPYYEHFYRNLKNFQHFVSFSKDPRVDLVKKVKWLKRNDKKAFEIMKNARKFVRENLAPRNIFCYHLLLFEELRKKITSPIEVQSDMEEVERKNIKCNCD